MTERKPHKYADAIKAWADGKPIQYKPNKESTWINYDPDYSRRLGINQEFYSSDVPKFDKFEWRVKPKHIVAHICAFVRDDFIKSIGISSLEEPNLQLEFDPETKRLIKAEVIG